MKYSFTTLFVLAILFLSSCCREPLYDDGGYLKLQINVVQKIMHEGIVPLPEKMHILFCDTTTHEVMESRFVGPNGGVLYLPSGYYDMLIYNYDTESTIVRNDEELNDIEAYTNEMPSEVSYKYKRLLSALKAKAAKDAQARINAAAYSYDTRSSDAIVYEPDHLFANKYQRVCIPLQNSQQQDTTLIKDTVRTILETYSIKIGPITGMQYIRSAELFLTGQTRSNYFGRQERSKVSSTIFFPVAADSNKEFLYTTFRTFGKRPGADNRVYLYVEITDTSGEAIDSEWDVTDQFDDPYNTNHEIVINVPIVVSKPVEGGGFKPEVDEWDSDTTKIVMQ